MSYNIEYICSPSNDGSYEHADTLANDGAGNLLIVDTQLVPQVWEGGPDYLRVHALGGQIILSYLGKCIGRMII